MNPSPIPPPPTLQTRADFAAAVLWGLGAAIARGARRITLVDADFAAWPLDDPALHTQLVPWLRLPQRRLVLLAAGYDEVVRRHPRFVRWRRDWSHATEAWSPSSGQAADMPTLLLDDGPVLVHLIDPVHWRGRAQLDAVAAAGWRERIDAVLQQSEPAFPVTALGI